MRRKCLEFPKKPAEKVPSIQDVSQMAMAGSPQTGALCEESSRTCCRPPPAPGEASGRLSCFLPPRFYTFLRRKPSEQISLLFARCGRALCKIHIAVLPNGFQRLANIYAVLEGC